MPHSPSPPVPPADAGPALQPLPALRDNYIWLLAQDGAALVVDPGEAAPVQRALRDQGLQLAAILVTHHHADHVGGVAELLRTHRVPVYGPRREAIAGVDQPLEGGETLELLGLPFQVLAVPGHTAGHIAYHSAPAELLFCGDTLFGAGCGRLFEGSPAQMLASLDQLAALPEPTRVCCAHEYTLANLRFARTVEPGNAELGRRQLACETLRAQGRPTLPSSLGEELRTNPFLRSDAAAVRRAAQEHRDGAGASRLACFAAIRDWKDRFS